MSNTDTNSSFTSPMDAKELAKLQLYQVIAAIPWGKVASYGQLAQLAGRDGAARWVGYCLRNLPADSNLPWHRVVTASGKLAFSVNSHNYQRQYQLLITEDIEIQRHKINMKQYQWRP